MKCTRSSISLAIYSAMDHDDELRATDRTGDSIASVDRRVYSHVP